MNSFVKEMPTWLHWIVRGGRRLGGEAPKLLPYVFVALLAFALAPLLWLTLSVFIPAQQSFAAVHGRRIVSRSAVALLLRGDPFGAPPPSYRGTSTSGISTSSLALKLIGVAVLPDPHKSLAILEMDKIARVYRVGSTLPGGAQIVSVTPERVILRYQGTLQAVAFRRGQPGNPQSFVGYGPPTLGRAERFPTLTARLLAHPSNLMTYLRPFPVYKNGQFTGIRLYPGPNSSLFARVGLHPGDLLTAVNGVRLTNPLQGYNLIEHFASRHVPIVLSITRNGASLVISLPSSSAL